MIAAPVLGIPALVGLMGWASGRLTGPPSDAQLLAQFHQNQPTLDRLVGMIQHDKGLKRVDCDWTNPDNPGKIGVSPARIAEYRHLLDSVGIHRGFDAWNGPSVIDFNNWGQGSAISSDTDKGIAYLAQPPAHTLGSLDGCGSNANGMEAYRHITGHWYLYYDYIPG